MALGSRWQFGRAITEIAAVFFIFFFCAEARVGSASEVKLTDPRPVFAVNAWTTEHGLPGNAIYALAPAADGYLWTAGLNGLARFDGVRFVRFRLWEGLPSLETLHLVQDTAGRLWVGTDDAGVVVLENRRFRSFARTNGLGGDIVRALAEDGEGKVWVAHDQGLARWDGSQFVNMHLPTENGKQSGCKSVFCGGKSIWALGEDWVLHEWRNGKWQTAASLQKTGFRFERVFETGDGQVWAQLYPYGLGRLQGDQWFMFGPESGLTKSYIRAVLDQGNGVLLYGTYEQGLFVFQNGRAAPVPLAQVPNLDGVLSIKEDKLGNIWVGTRAQGLLRLRRPRVQVVPGTDQMRIARIAFDNRGRFWMGSGEGLAYQQGEKFVSVPVPTRLPKLSVATLTPCPEGGMWIAVARNGLWEFDPDRYEVPIQKLPGSSDDMMGVLLAQDRAGGFWFGSERGELGHLQKGETNLLGQVPHPADRRVVQLMGDARGGVWARIVGTGMIRLNAEGKELERVGLAEGLPVNSVRCWLSDGEGGLWMGSPMGLYWWHQSKLLLFDTRHGLPDDLVLNLANDVSGHIWCAAQNQLFRLSKQEMEEVATRNGAVAHPRVIGASAGLKSIPFAAGIASRAVRAPNGRLFFPRVWDVISFDPAEFEQPEAAPTVRIEEVSLDGRRVDLSSANPQLRIPAGTAEIGLRYTGLGSVAPETLRFRYRFDGTDKDWSEVGEQRMVNFRHLPPGSYRFRITASAAGGEWADPGAVIAWTLEPFFWQTTWFRMLAAIAAGSIVAVLVWQRVRNVEKRRLAQELFSRKLLESQEVERRRIAVELHDGLGQNLVLVKNLAAFRMAGNGEETSPPQTAEIVAAAERALEEVHAISYALRPPELDRLGLAKAISVMVRRAAEASGIRFETRVQFDGKLPAGSDIQLFRIAQEAVNNLIKHSGASTARVELWQDEAGLHLVVADDGCGLPDNPERTSDGSGLGLSGIEERARLIGAQCKWLSPPRQGTTLSVFVPGSHAL
jgi:signal transduction histidine kinase/ligand-binding sensor domain-containing protein